MRPNAHLRRVCGTGGGVKPLLLHGTETWRSSSGEYFYKYLWSLKTHATCTLVWIIFIRLWCQVQGVSSTDMNAPYAYISACMIFPRECHLIIEWFDKKQFCPRSILGQGHLEGTHEYEGLSSSSSSSIPVLGLVACDGLKPYFLGSSWQPPSNGYMKSNIEKILHKWIVMSPGYK
jgi:hypothetical protein